MSVVSYEVKNPILGFENIEKVTLEQNDGITSILKGCGTDCVQLTLINTFIGGSDFVIPSGIKVLLDITDNTNYSVYFVVVLNKKSIQNSTINLGSPMIFNEDNHTMAQLSVNTETGTISELFN
ncbi:MAG: flagellar assembly protein FliW [Arcobacteraceae bacterium]|jgi:flagellar assembly factor FliW|nr:flagellar assembly protein FliW [Arcobacteraceae bacterium]MDY0328722.1 flagellar assembly protein FliW [Arcobacteraceae bacterium]